MLVGPRRGPIWQKSYLPEWILTKDVHVVNWVKLSVTQIQRNQKKKVNCVLSNSLGLEMWAQIQILQSSSGWFRVCYVLSAPDLISLRWELRYLQRYKCCGTLCGGGPLNKRELMKCPLEQAANAWEERQKMRGERGRERGCAENSFTEFKRYIRVQRYH